MLKLDLESAFQHIPVCTEDWLLLSFKWQGHMYHNVILAFDARSAPYIFNLFAKSLHWVLQRNIPACICHYLDNFLSIFPPATACAMVQDTLDWTLTLGNHLGLLFQPSKIVRPSTTIEFLSLELNSVEMEVCLPQDKLEYLRELIVE